VQLPVVFAFLARQFGLGADAHGVLAADYDADRLRIRHLAKKNCPLSSEVLFFFKPCTSVFFEW
jgi:hypothetical protein